MSLTTNKPKNNNLTAKEIIMQYSWNAKNFNKDNIFMTRLYLIEKLNINIYQSRQMYSYYMNAYLGIIL